MSSARTSSRPHRMPKAACEWQVGLVSPGLWCRARAEQPTHSYTPKAGERLRREITDPPSSLGFPCRISRRSQEMAGQPYESTSRRSREGRHRDRHRAAGLLGGVTGEPLGMPQRWLRVTEPCSLTSEPRPCWDPLELGGHLSPGEPRSRRWMGTDRDATTSKPVTPPRRVIPGLQMIDFGWEETGSGLVGQTRV